MVTFALSFTVTMSAFNYSSVFKYTQIIIVMSVYVLVYFDELAANEEKNKKCTINKK